MAAEIIRDAVIVLGAFDFENAAKSCSINYTYPTQDVTGFGDGAKRFLIDTPEWTVDIEFTDDFAATKVNEQLWTMKGTEQTFKARKQTGTIGPANPEFQGNVLLLQIPVLTAGVGQVPGGRLTLQGSGTLVRAVA
jgi:hypothetical protein